MEYSIESLIAESTGMKSVVDDRFVNSEETSNVINSAVKKERDSLKDVDDVLNQIP